MNTRLKILLFKIIIFLITLTSLSISYFYYENEYKRDMRYFIDKEVAFYKDITLLSLHDVIRIFEQKKTKFMQIHKYAMNKLEQNPNINLEKLKKELIEKYYLYDTQINLFLIDKSYIIYKTTFPKDLYFSLSKSSNALKKLKKISNNNDIVTLDYVMKDPMDMAYKTYSYSRLSNGNFLELGFENRSIKNIFIHKLQNNNKKHVKATLYSVKNLKGNFAYFPFLQSETNSTKKEFLNSLDKYKLNDHKNNPVMKTFFTHKNTIVNKKNSYIEYVKIYDDEKHYGLQNIIAKIEVDITRKDNFLRTIRNIFFWTVAIVCILLLTMFFMLKKELVEPINLIIQNIKNAKKIPISGRENNNNEFYRIAKEYNTMYDHLSSEIKKNAELTHIDYLTNLNNRKSFDEKLFELAINLKRYKVSFTVILFDLDDFKKVNDSFGHQKGDEVLVKVAKIIKKSLRVNDYSFRVGGEEFAILLPQTKLKNSLIIAKKIQNTINEEFISLRKTSLTISGGAYEATIEDSVDSIYAKVDNLLYIAKNSGKNNIKSDIAN